MELNQYLSLWKEVLSVEKPATSTADSIAHTLAMPRAQLEMYRKFVHNHYFHAIHKMYPRLKKVAPPLFTNEFILSYFQKSAPTSWELNGLAKDFPSFLKQQTHLSPAWEAWAELAEYEWARFCIFTHPADEKALAAETSKGFLTLSPALYLLQFQHGISEWVEQIDAHSQTTETTPAKLSTPQILIISRAEEPFRTLVTELSIPALALLQSLAEGPRPPSECLFAAQQSIPIGDDCLQKEIEILLEEKILIIGSKQVSGQES